MKGFCFKCGNQEIVEHSRDYKADQILVQCTRCGEIWPRSKSLIVKDQVGNKVPYGSREAVYRQAIEKFGEQAQIRIAVEEMAELTKELCKSFRGKQNREEIIEEIADVTIMMEQLRLIFDCNQDVCDQMDFKVERLLRRMTETADRG